MEERALLFEVVPSEYDWFIIGWVLKSNRRETTYLKLDGKTGKIHRFRDRGHEISEEVEGGVPTRIEFGEFSSVVKIEDGEAWCFDFYRREPAPDNLKGKERYSRRHGCVTLVLTPKFSNEEKRYEFVSRPELLRGIEVSYCTLVTRGPFLPQHKFLEGLESHEKKTNMFLNSFRKIFKPGKMTDDRGIRSHITEPLEMGNRVSTAVLGTEFHLWIENSCIEIEEEWFEYYMRAVQRENRTDEYTPDLVLDALSYWISSHDYVADRWISRGDEKIGNNYQPCVYQTATNCKDNAMTFLMIYKTLVTNTWKEATAAFKMKETLFGKYVPVMTSANYGKEGGNHAFIVVFDYATISQRLFHSKISIKKRETFLVEVTMKSPSETSEGRRKHHHLPENFIPFETPIDKFGNYKNFIVGMTSPCFFTEFDKRRLRDWTFWFTTHDVGGKFGVRSLKDLTEGNWAVKLRTLQERNETRAQTTAAELVARASSSSSSIVHRTTESVSEEEAKAANAELMRWERPGGKLELHLEENHHLDASNAVEACSKMRLMDWEEDFEKSPDFYVPKRVECVKELERWLGERECDVIRRKGGLFVVYVKN